jgi:hypothetical protein
MHNRIRSSDAGGYFGRSFVLSPPEHKVPSKKQRPEAAALKSLRLFFVSSSAFAQNGLLQKL